MANEDARVQSVLSSLLNTYQMPYNMMSGLQQNALGLLNAQMQQQAQNQSSKDGLLGSLVGAVGSGVGGYLSRK
ncbi:MAG: hypothetical protein BWY54_01049 [Candidatus Dependentiae bacterium ADurb.Bin331]|nr:MAG: hypothetical protein BWY54_01049 [Candidatus Dependentiae bacterium ADurb.Bin331]